VSYVAFIFTECGVVIGVDVRGGEEWHCPLVSARAHIRTGKFKYW
jgi:hypothetical protein